MRIWSLAILLLSASAIAQTTVVITGQVLDPNGKIYQNGNGRAVLVPQNVNWLVNSTNPVPTPIIISGLDAFGRFSIAVTRTDLISPQTLSPKWQFSFCSQATDFSPVCFTMTPLVITTAQDITTQIQAQSALLPATGAGGNVSSQGTWTPGHMVTIFDTTHLQDLGVTGGGVGALGVLNIAPNFTGTVTMAGLKFPAQTGLTSCMYIDPTGLVNFTGTACGAGGGGGVFGSNKQLFLNNAGSGAGTAVVAGGNVVSQMTYDVVSGRTSIPNLSNIRYAAEYAWSQAPAADLTTFGAKTVTLTPCPFGVDTSNNSTYPYYVYISTTGTPEVVLVTGGTCTGGAASGTLTFTTVNTHANGYTLSSASGGIAEASLSIGNNNQKIVLSPAATSASPITNAYSFYAPVYLRYSNISIEGGGAQLLLNNPNAIFFSQLTNLSLRDVRVASSIDYPGQLITNTACTAGVSTITTTLNPVVGSWVDIQFTFNKYYWGTHQVISSSGSSWTYNDGTNCGGAVNISSAASDGANAPEATLLHDNGFYNTYIDNVFFDRPGAVTGHLNNGIVVYNDQGLHVNNTSYDNGMWCSQTYCSSAIYAPGPFSTRPAVMWLDNDNLTMNCTGNGVTDYAGNDLKISGGVIQGFNMWSINTGRLKGGFGGGHVSGLHIESGGSCPNPWFSNAVVSAGLLNHGGPLTIQGGEGPNGAFPAFASGGATTYYYYVVVKDSALGASQPLYAGAATPTGTAVTVNWWRVPGTNTVTYDLLRTTDSSNYPTTAGCVGGTTSGCGSRTTAKAQCSANICSFTDDVSANTTAYTVVNFPGFQPFLAYWPGHLVLSPAGDTAFNNFATNDPGSVALAGLNVSNSITPIVTTAGTTTPTIYSQDNSVTGSLGAWVISSTTVPIGIGGVNRTGATLLSNGFPAGGFGESLKGRLNFLGGSTIAPHGHIITLVDSKQDKTKAQGGYRPSADAADTSICLDNGQVVESSASLCFTAPIAISNYINALPDGSAWLERLTATDKTIKVKTTVNDGTGATQFKGTYGTPTNPGDTNHSTLAYDASGDLAYNKKNTTNFRKVIPQDYTIATLPVTSVDSGQLAVVTDAISSGCPLTGGGSIRVLVRWNGSTWDCVSGGGGTTISTSTFASLPGSPPTGTFAVVNDWTGTCPVTTGSGSPGKYLLVRWSGSGWDCVTPTSVIPFNFTAQPWDGTQALGSTGGYHFGTASSSLTNTNGDTNALFLYQGPLIASGTASQLAFVDGLGNSYFNASWAANLSLPPSTTKKCVDIDYQGHLQFFSGDCLVDPTTANGDIIIRAGGVLARLPKDTDGKVLTLVAGLPAWGSVLTNPMTTKGDLIQSSDNSGTPARLPIGATGQVMTVQSSGLWAPQNATIGGTVNSGAVGQLSYYQAAGTAVSGLANTVGSDGVAAPVIAITTTSATKEDLLLNCITPGANCFGVQIGGVNKLFVDSAGALNLSGAGTKAANNYVYQSQSAAQAVDYSQGADSNATQGIATFRCGNVTGTGNFTAGTCRFQPGALTNAAPGASAVEGKIIFNGAVLKKGATVTNGNVGCIESDNTVRDCSSTANNHKFVGVIESTVGGSTYVQTAGSVVVNLDASSTFNSNDFVCVSTTGAAQGHMNGTTACPGYNDHIGFAIAGGTTVSTVNVVLVR